MKLIPLSVFAAVIISISSCKKEESPGPAPITKANISGSVNLYDEGTTKIDNSGMLVKVEGTSPSISSITDNNGAFTLLDVPFGTYTLIYEKAGYGTFKRFNVVHKDGNTIIPDAPSLGQTSTTKITNLTTSSSSSFPVILSATTDPVANQANTRYIRFFLSTNPNVSNENFESYFDTFPVNITPYNLNLSQAALDALSYTSGTTVYVKCYGESFWGNNYTDPNLGRDVFPNLNPVSAAAVSFVMP